MACTEARAGPPLGAFLRRLPCRPTLSAAWSTNQLSACPLWRCVQGEDADEARERPAWMAGGTESAEEGATSPAASAGLPSVAGSAPGTAKAAANGGAAADLLDLLGERWRGG